jgi:hypothetical protein
MSFKCSCDGEFSLDDLGMTAVPEGDWFCATCTKKKATQSAPKRGGKKAAAAAAQEPPQEELKAEPVAVPAASAKGRKRGAEAVEAPKPEARRSTRSR